MNRLIFTVVALIAIAVGLLVGTLNSDKVILDLLWVQIRWPLGLLLLLSLAGGLLLGIVMIYLSQVFPLRLRLRKSQAKVSKALDLQGPGLDVSRADD